MLYVCDLWVEREGDNYVRPYGHFFLDFKTYPTSLELYNEIVDKFCEGVLNIKVHQITGATFDGKRNNFCSGICFRTTANNETTKYYLNATNLRALPKVRNKEKYLKNGKE